MFESDLIGDVQIWRYAIVRLFIVYYSHVNVSIAYFPNCLDVRYTTDTL